jgi:hypothetical protein
LHVAGQKRNPKPKKTGVPGALLQLLSKQLSMHDVCAVISACSTMGWTALTETEHIIADDSGFPEKRRGGN